MQHAIRLTDALELLDTGQTLLGGCGGTGGSSEDSNGGGGNGRGGSSGGRGNGRGGRGGGRANGNEGSSSNGTNCDDDDKTPLCLWEPHRCQGIRHYPKDCPTCPPEEKGVLYAKPIEEKNTDKVRRQERGCRRNRRPRRQQHQPTPAQSQPRAGYNRKSTSIHQTARSLCMMGLHHMQASADVAMAVMIASFLLLSHKQPS